jgi:beta-lactam-binding protein with PASTA domain
MWRTLPPFHHVDYGMPDDDGARRRLLGAMPVPQSDPDDGIQPRGTLSAPDLRGMAARDARRIARMSDLHVLVTTRPTDEALWDRVVAQVPVPGVAMAPGDSVEITVGARPAVVVPDVRGGEEAEMLAVLREAGLRPERRVARRSDSVPEGHIVRTRPRAGTCVPYGTQVAYIVATPRPLHRRQARRHEKRVRVRRLPDGSFLSLPSDE